MVNDVELQSVVEESVEMVPLGAISTYCVSQEKLAVFRYFYNLFLT